MNRKKVIIITSSVLGVITLLAGTFFIYTSFYYHADETRINAYLASKKATVTQISKNKIEIKGNTTRAGVIFYPGAKVEYTSYEPLLASLAEHGYMSVLVKMPFNLAIFGTNRANGIIDDYPHVDKWYLMGHSLGGAMISNYAASHAEEFEGLILLGSYPNKDLSQTGLSLVTIYGSEDGVLNRSKYESSKSYWPSDSKEYVIEGGCHAGFGMYGAQKGDGTPTITTEEQIEKTVQDIVGFYSVLE